jgi:hypothetical protein
MSTLSSNADYLQDRADALSALKSARRANRVENIDRFDAFYKAYLGAILSGIALYAIAGYFGDTPIRGAGLESFTERAPAVIGLVIALAIAIGMRSAGRGGPLAFETADVRHVLLSPVDRVDAVGAVALRMLRHNAFIGLSAGAALGVIATRRLPEHPASWIAAGAACGLGAALMATGTTLAVASRKPKAWQADILALAIIGWAVADVVVPVELSPMSLVGDVAVWATQFSVLGIVGLVLAALAGFVGYKLSDAVSLESAERRAKLVGQLKFAATTQDVRTVMLLQRQLAQQGLRSKPRLKLRKARPRTEATAGVVARRNLQSMLRWPLVRVARLFALFAVFGASIFGVWAGTAPLMVVGGLALWLAALDLHEGLAQESDHPDRLEGAPEQRGLVYLRHMALPALIVLVMTALAALPALLLGPPELQSVFGPLIVPLAALAVAGAALVVARPPEIETGFISAEVTGLKILAKSAIPPLLPIFGMLPLVLGRTEWMKNADPEATFAAINFPSSAAIAFATWAILWIRYSETLRKTFSPAAVQEKAAEAERKSSK